MLGLLHQPVAFFGCNLFLRPRSFPLAYRSPDFSPAGFVEFLLILLVPCSWVELWIFETSSRVVELSFDWVLQNPRWEGWKFGPHDWVTGSEDLGSLPYVMWALLGLARWFQRWPSWWDLVLYQNFCKYCFMTQLALWFGVIVLEDVVAHRLHNLLETILSNIPLVPPEQDPHRSRSYNHPLRIEIRGPIASPQLSKVITIRCG